VIDDWPTFRVKSMCCTTPSSAGLASLFAAVDEVMRQKLAQTRGGIAKFTDPFSPRPYRIHFFDVAIEGGTIDGRYDPANSALVTVVEDETGELDLGAPDMLHDLTPRPDPGNVELVEQRNDRVRRFVMAQVQYEMMAKVRAERAREIEIRRGYLEASFEILARRARGASGALRARGGLW
jgi:hypothetical protein